MTVGARGALALLLLGSGVYAQPTSEPTEPTTTTATTSPVAAEQFTLNPAPAPDSIDSRLADAMARPAGILKYGPVSLIDPLVDRMNESLDKYGLNIGFSYTAVYQVASGGPGQRQAAGGDADLFGTWRLLGAKDDPYMGLVGFSVENRHELFTPIPPASLDTEIGSLWGTTNGFNEQPVTIKEMYWEQHIQADRLIVRAGKLDPENYYNSNYWQSDSKFFLNQAFSSFPVRAFPSNGLGVNATAKLSDQWYISTGFQDAQGVKTTGGFDTFFNDLDLFSAFEVRFTPNIQDVGRGTYRLCAWYRAAGESNDKPHDAGIDLSIDQRVGEHLIPFFRWGIGEGNINGIEDMISAGVGWEGALITKSDVVGIGGAWGQPSDHDLRDQYAVEVFYRLQVSPDNQLTVGYQVIFDPSNDPDTNIVGVFELRWRITF